MKNTQLFEILGEIDNKFYDEALGGDSEKPLKIDTSVRQPLKWYRIAAPIAACLVLGVGIFTVSRYLDRPSDVDTPNTSSYTDTSSYAETSSDNTSDDPDTSSDTNTSNDSIDLGFVSAVDTDIEACKQMLLAEDPDIPGFETRIMDMNFDGADDVVLGAYNKAPGLYIFSKSGSDGMIQTGYINTVQDHSITYGIENSLIPYNVPEDGAPYWYFHYFGEDPALRLHAEAIGRIRYNGTEYVVDYPVAVYSDSFSSYKVDDVTLMKNWNMLHDFYGEGKDTGVEIDRAEFLTLWKKHYDLAELGDTFADYLAGDDDPFNHRVDTFFPYLDLNAIPLMDSASFDSDTAPVIKRARIAETSACSNSSLYAALVGENIFRLAEDSNEYMRMEKLSVIYYYKTKLYAQVYLDPAEAGGGRGNFIIRAKSDLPLGSYHIDKADDMHVIVVGGEDFMLSDKPCCSLVLLNTLGGTVDAADPKLTVLKGIYEGSDTVVSHINTSNYIVQSENSLYDTKTGTTFTFFPEMFGYADPDAAHAHFKFTTPPPSDVTELKGGYVHSLYDDDIPEKGSSRTVNGTQADLDRWYSFISSVKPAVIHAKGMEEHTFKLSDQNAAKIFSILKMSALTVFPDDYNSPPPTGGSEFFVGCGSDGSVLFDALYNGAWLYVTFDDSDTTYIFNAKNSGISDLTHYTYDPDQIY